RSPRTDATTPFPRTAVRAVVCLTFGVVAASCALTARSAQNPGPPLRAAADQPYGTCAGKVGHLPATSCAAASCHGGPAGRAGGELTTWAPQAVTTGPHDPHAKAYRVLFNPESQRMAEYLRLGSAHKAELCLKCHAVDGAGPEMAAEGVGCGAC